MKDEILEQHLRELPAPELPEAWRAQIISAALREADASAQNRQIWPTILVYLRTLCLRNSVTATALTALWILIFLLKLGTPIDPAEKMFIAHDDPNRPVHFVSIRDEIRLAELLQDQPEPEHRQTP